MIGTITVKQSSLAGVTLYAVLALDTADLWWNGTAFVPRHGSRHILYSLPLQENAPGSFSATIPSGVPSSSEVTAYVYIQSGAFPDPDDSEVARGNVVFKPDAPPLSLGAVFTVQTPLAGLSLYAVLVQAGSHAYLNQTAFEPRDDAHWALYAVPLSESPTVPGYFSTAVLAPAALPVVARVYVRRTATPLPTDDLVADGMVVLSPAVPEGAPAPHHRKMSLGTRDLVFADLAVDFLVRGVARVSWRLFYQFHDPGPYMFQLQSATTAVPAADDWAPVGPPIVGGSYALDMAPRARGTQATVHYRVVLSTPSQTYYSNPTDAGGVLGVRDWLEAQEIVRKERLLQRRYTGVDGWLLKRRHVGAPAPSGDPRTAVVDPLTGEVVRRKSTVALGTEFAGGYFPSVPYSVTMDLSSSSQETDPEQAGNVDRAGLSRSGRVVAIPQICNNDLFVAAGSDLRYYVQLRKQAAHVRGVPIVYECDFRQAQFDDVAYDVPLT